MKENRIRYFSYYGCSDANNIRDNSPAADTKVDYIINVLNRKGYGVDHISLAQSSIGKYLPRCVERKGENTFLWFASFPRTDTILHIFNRWFVNFQFCVWCIINIKRNEQVIVYHSLGYDALFVLLKRIFKFRIIGEIEEIYQDVSRQRHSQERNEYRFVEMCDKYIFSNTLLHESLNRKNKSYLVCHGIYKVNECKVISFNDDKIHILYAGTLDMRKGGALLSVQVAEFLDERYHLHIAGFGSKELESIIIAEIRRVQPHTKCLITFHGYLHRKDLVDLMHHCTIGLCTQNPDGMFNLTSFPSKILDYMTNGLVVISGKNRSILESMIGDVINYYDFQDPKCIAQSILMIKNSKPEIGFERLRYLDSKFAGDIISLINVGD